MGGFSSPGKTPGTFNISTTPPSGPRSKMSNLFGSGSSAASTASNNTQGDLSKDVQVQNPPEDSVSELRFSPQTDHLAVASWDKKVRIYEISSTGESKGVAMLDHEGPALNCCWSGVCIKHTALFGNWDTDGYGRTARKSSVLGPTKLGVCWI